MLSRTTAFAWIGIILLSGMFLMGQQSWAPQPKWKTVFLTENDYTGDLGGLEGADAICQAEADTAGLPGRYMAWLSDTNEGPAARFEHSTEPYVRVDGVLVATNWDDLTDGAIDNPITVTASGDERNVEAVWSNTTVAGLPWNYFGNPHDSCDDWSRGEENCLGFLGSVSWWYYNPDGDPAAWTAMLAPISGGLLCNQHGVGLYCFQQ